MSKLKLEWDNCVLLARRICNDITVELRTAYQDEIQQKGDIEFLKKQLYETEFCEIAGVSPEYIIQRAYKQAKKGVKSGKYSKLS